MIPYKWPVQASAPQTLSKRLEIAQAIHALAAPEEDGGFRQRRAEIASIRRDLNALALATHELQRACDSRLRSYVLKAAADDPKHPGWPAGAPGGKGGQFRPKDGDADDVSPGSANGAETSRVMGSSPSQVAQALPPSLLLEEPPVTVRPPLPEFPTDPTVPPGPGFEWRGQPWTQPGDPEGSWFNPNTGETLRPDMDHPPPTPPHWDYRAPNRQWYRWFPDGRLELRA